jgi:hypothetical protein
MPQPISPPPDRLKRLLARAYFAFRRTNNMETMTTTDLSEYGFRELNELEILLKALRLQGLPSEFSADGVTPMFNKNSGNVFLTNSDCQVAMMNGGKLEMFYSCPECGCEGFAEDLKTDFKYKNANQCCMDYLTEMGA